MVLRSAGPVAAALLAAACSLSPAPVEQVLAASADERCVAAVAAWRAEAADAERALVASRLLFEVVDVRVQRALVAAAAAVDAPDVAALLALEETLPAGVRDEVLSLCTTGVEAAQAALAALAARDDLATQRVEAQVHLALHTTFLAWASGPMRSMVAGYASRVLAAADAAIAIEPSWQGASPLRLKGRFLARAPWPVGDGDAALALLERAVAVAPMPINHLFLGDHLYARGALAAAAEQWRLVLTSEPDEATGATAPFHRDMARLRLRLLGDWPG